MTDGQIALFSVETIDDNTFVYHYETGNRMRRFLSGEPLRVEYEGSVKDIPEEIAVIPFLGFISQIIWFYDGELEIAALDETYARSLEKVKTVYRTIYPQAALSGRIDIKKKIAASGRDGAGKAVFFTGGVDSTATALRHRTENPLLISIWGSEARVHQEKAWKKVNASQNEAAVKMGLKRMVIKSNYRDIMNQWALEPYFPGSLRRSWYVEIAYGSIFLGLAAPLAWREGVGKIYFAAGYTAQGTPDGSSPALIEKMAWAGTRVACDGVNEERQTKLERITDFNDFSGLKLNVCTLGCDEGNCGLCEKCSRTIAGLALMGIDPSRHGFILKPDSPQQIRTALENDKWRDYYAWQLANLKFWREIQERIPPRMKTALPEWREFFNWLALIDLSVFFLNHPPTVYQEIKTKLKRWLPFPVYAAIRQFKINFKKL